MTRLPSVKSSPILRGLARCMPFWFPKEFLQLAASGFVKLDPFAFQHSLLLVCWQNDSPSRTLSLRIDYAVPRSVSLIGSVHHKADGPRRVTFAQHVGDLSVGHDAARWNTANDLINAFAVFFVGCAFGR